MITRTKMQRDVSPSKSLLPRCCNHLCQRQGGPSCNLSGRRSVCCIKLKDNVSTIGDVSMQCIRMQMFSESLLHIVVVAELNQSEMLLPFCQFIG